MTSGRPCIGRSGVTFGPCFRPIPTRRAATLNSKGERVGLLFDGTIESVNSDWDFDPRTTRTIHVDTRYMLWVMDKIDGAAALIEEMDVVR